MTIECDVKDAEQCGWAKDKFGLSWQIVPYNIGELTKMYAQMQTLIKMNKIIIKELEEAGTISCHGIVEVILVDLMVLKMVL